MRVQSISLIMSVCVSSFVLTACTDSNSQSNHEWSKQEWQLVESLSLANLPVLPTDASNQYLHQTTAAAFGKALFFDPRFSRDGQVSCSSCHQPTKHFADGVALAQGLAVGTRNTPALHGVAYNQWFFWDGRKDSLWAQAIGPWEDEHEHGLTRTDVLRMVFSDPTYRALYQQIFPTTNLPAIELLSVSAKPSGTVAQISAWQTLSMEQRTTIDRHYSNLGKVLAAYVATLKPQPTRLDAYIEAARQGHETTALNAEELQGLRLFISQKAQCINCHSGPLLTNQGFHSTGTGEPGKDTGRAAVLDELRVDRFNCQGEFSDAATKACPDLTFMQRSRHQVYGAYKTPSLRNVSQTAPYFHDGRLTSLDAVVDYYVTASQRKDLDTHLSPIYLNREEKQQLVAFLKALTAVEPANSVN